MMLEAALLVTALLFGGMTLYAFGFAAFVFGALPAEEAGRLIRRAFPRFYLFVFVSSAVAAILAASRDPLSAAVLVAVAATTVVARQGLMPAINAASDTGAKTRFKVLHSISVALTLGHIAGAAAVLLRLAAA